MKKFLSLALAFAMTFSLAAPAMAAEKEEEAVTILYTNDAHCYINNTRTVKDGETETKVPALRYSTIAAYKDSLENVLLVDAGDHTQGNAYGGMDQGESIVKMMNAAGYDAATLGNHEFDYQMEGCLNTIERAQFPYLSCNFFHEKDGVRGDNVLDSYKVFEVAGKKVAFVGMSTPETFTATAPVYFQDGEGNYIYGFSGTADPTELYADVQKAIDAASQEADIVIGLGHMGVDENSAATSRDVIANTTGLTAFIDGHSHTTIPMEEVTDKEGKTVILTQTGSYLNAMGKMTITADGAVKAELLTAEDLAEVEPKAEVKALEDAWIKDVDERLGQVVAETDINFTINYPDGTRAVRLTETNMGDLNADAMYWYMNEAEGIDVDLAITNGGGVRASIDAGEWSYLTCKTVNTFGNQLCIVNVSGQAILDGLELGAKGTPLNENNGCILQSAGITYDINTTIPDTVKVDEKGNWIGGPEAYRVTNVKVYNKETKAYEPLDLNKTYAMAGTNFILLNQGGGFNFVGATTLKDYIAEDYMAFAEYLKAFEDTDGDGLPNITSAASPLAAYENYVIDYEIWSGAERIRPVALYEVTADKWYYETVIDVIQLGLMQGTGEAFEAEKFVTEASVLQTLYNMEGKPEAAEETEAWYTNAVTWATGEELIADFTGDSVIDRGGVKAILEAYCAMKGVSADGLMKGNEQGDLMLDKGLTRAEFAQLLVNLSAAPMPQAG